MGEWVHKENICNETLKAELLKVKCSDLTYTTTMTTKSKRKYERYLEGGDGLEKSRRCFCVLQRRPYFATLNYFLIKAETFLSSFAWPHFIVLSRRCLLRIRVREPTSHQLFVAHSLTHGCWSIAHKSLLLLELIEWKMYSHRRL